VRVYFTYGVSSRAE